MVGVEVVEAGAIDILVESAAIPPGIHLAQGLIVPIDFHTVQLLERILMVRIREQDSGKI